MVKRRKVSAEVRDRVFDYSKCKGYRKKLCSAALKTALASEAMTDGEAKDSARCQASKTEASDGRSKEFLASCRARRRNALTEFLEGQTVALIELAERLEDLTVDKGGQNGGQDGSSPGPSKQQD